MNILYVTTSYLPAIGGGQVYLHSLAKLINKIGNDVKVVTDWSINRNDWLLGTTIFSEKEKNYEYEGIEVFQIGFSVSQKLRMLPWVLSYYFLMAPAVQKISNYSLPFFEKLEEYPSLIHAIRIGREFIVKASLEFAHKHNIPFVLSPLHHDRWKGYLYWEYDKIYRAADAIIVLTEEEKRLLIATKGVKEERIWITGMGPVLSEIYSEEDFREKYHLYGRFVLFVGQHYKYKGFSAILKAAPLVWRNHPDVKFVFIGPHTSFSNKVFRHITDPRIINLGIVDLRTKTSALAACDFLCMPSSQESFGGVYIEAWALGKAVIGGKNPAIACVIEHGKDGFLSSQHPGELSHFISFLLSNPQRSEAMGVAGWQKVQDRFTWEILAKKTLEIYKKLA